MLARRIALISCSVTSILVTAAADARAAGACTLEVPVRFGAGGTIQQTERGTATCVGAVGRRNVDPGRAPVRLTGTARSGAVGCTPQLVRGQLEMDLRHLMSMDPFPTIAFAAAWTGANGAISGTATIDGARADFLGPVHFEPAGGACRSTGLVPGTVHVALAVGDARPRTRTEIPSITSGVLDQLS